MPLSDMTAHTMKLGGKDHIALKVVAEDSTLG